MGQMKEKLYLESNDDGDLLPFASTPVVKNTGTFHFVVKMIQDVAAYSYSWIYNQLQKGQLRSVYIVMIKAKINLLLPFGPLAILLHYLTRKHGLVFFFSLLGITPLSERFSYATEQLAFYSGPAVGGLLNATFGNAMQMIISIYALNKGMIRVVQQSLLGSILSNMLLVLGCAFFVGGIIHHCKIQVFNKQSLLGSILSNMLLVLGCAFFVGGIIHHCKIQVFNKASAVVNSGLLLMAVMGITLPAILHFTRTEVHFGKSELALSRFSSCVMLIAYAISLFFQLKGQPNLYNCIDEENIENEGDVEDDEAPELTQWEVIAWLSILTVWVSILSAYLVDAIQGASDSLNIPASFINVILLPVFGNGIMFSMKDKLDITLGYAIGSSTQISMFVIPFCVVVGWCMGVPMDLNFQPFETATLFITVLLVAFLLQEGTSNCLKGLMLIVSYLIVAASFFVHVDVSNA